MLPFGSFITSIPLIALAFAYMLFFGANAVRRIKPECSISVILDEKQQPEVSPEIKINNAFYYHDSIGSTDTGSVEEMAFASCPESFIFLQKGILNTEHQTHYYRGNTFSRPPPFLQ